MHGEGAGGRTGAGAQAGGGSERLLDEIGHEIGRKPADSGRPAKEPAHGFINHVNGRAHRHVTLSIEGLWKTDHELARQMTNLARSLGYGNLSAH